MPETWPEQRKRLELMAAAHDPCGIPGCMDGAAIKEALRRLGLLDIWLVRRGILIGEIIGPSDYASHSDVDLAASGMGRTRRQS